jgi:hypothetical protein
MLHIKSVSTELLELLTRLMRQEEFKDFILVGGTALALQLGHRISVDIDLFGSCEIDESVFLENLKENGNVQVLKKSKNILVCSVQGVKVDFVNYKYPLLERPLENNHIRMAAMKDIAAMKINAIAGRGSKKDFIDIYYILRYFTLDEMIDLYLQKYNDGSEFLARKSLTYFEDAELEEMPLMFDNITWTEIKKTILDAQ